MTSRLHARLLPLGVAALLLAGCNDGSGQTPTAAPASSGPTSSPDPFTAIAPPTAREVGDYTALIVNRALQQAQGLVALQLFEDSSVTGTDRAGLVEGLSGTAGDPAIKRDLGAAATARGLAYRPLFAPGVTVKAVDAKVERSVWKTDAVQGRGGEPGLRVGWSGSVRYSTTSGGKRQDVAYALNIGYVFAPVEGEPNGLQLVQVVRGTSHAAPVLASCVAKGVLLPVEGAPTPADFGPGPWTAPSGGAACPD